MNEADQAKSLLRGARGNGRFEDLAGRDVPIHLAHPFETMDLAGYHAVLDDLGRAFPDLERRVTIEISGRDGQGQLWVGQGGYWCGLFAVPFLDIPPTRRMAVMRFHDFFRVEHGAVVEMQSLWDLPELMMQAGVWPLSPSLGREFHVPGPATQDGLRVSGDGAEALGVVDDMLAGLGNDPAGTPRATMARFWHEHMSWYGPSGIGTARGIDGFRKHHQAPFLGGMPDRSARMDEGHLFAEGGYVGFTAWPGMDVTLTGGTWLGLPGAGQRLEMRSLDFWRVEAGKIAENWVLVDLLHVYHQLGVDVLARMRELVN
ncbi:ester cyclase [Gymnodinialimonas ulvae]|uniref:ester cyclase n=1 Tax=Gymnodinialimonas ulvae TaxID=3126504 RepID=UPI0030B31DD8